MANADTPTGFQPHGEIKRAQPYVAAAAVYPGDLVKLTSAGKVTPAASGTDAVVGVALTYAAADLAECMVADDPQQLVETQASAAEIDALTDMNLNYEISVGSPNTTYKRSGMEVASNTGATTATLPIKVLRAIPAADNALGANVRVVCKINNHQLAGGTGVEGV